MKGLRFLILFLFPWNLYATDRSDSISVRAILDTIGEIFYSIDAPLEPTGGMDAFFDRLARFLNSSKEVSGKYLHFYVATNGKLYVEDTSPTAAILNRFIRQEKNWSLGIHSGPTKQTCIYIELPIQEGKKAAYYRHLAYDNPQKPKGLDLYYSYVYPDFPYVDDIVSVINDNGQYSTVTVLKGKNVQNIVSFLTDKKTLTKGSSTKTKRIYFYLLPK